MAEKKIGKKLIMIRDQQQQQRNFRKIAALVFLCITFPCFFPWSLDILNIILSRK